MKIKTGKYNGVVCELSEVRQHSNADRLQVANALGYQVIVGMDAKNGDVGVLFPEGGMLTKNMLLENNLYRKHPETGEPMGGYFEQSGRIRTVKLRGENSEGFFTSLSSLNWIEKLPNMSVGTEFAKINGIDICEKYYTRATRSRMAKASRAYKKPWWVPGFAKKYHKNYLVNKKSKDPCPTFRKHFETNKLRMNAKNIQEGQRVIWTVKSHGTSGRTGYVRYDNRTLASKLLGRSAKYQYVTGTRNVVKNPAHFGKKSDAGYYSGTDFRHEAHQKIIERGLNKDEIIYYEILGWAGPTASIMPNHKLKWGNFKKVGYSEAEFAKLEDLHDGEITYHYGNEQGKWSIQVYRIMQNGVDLVWDDVVARCSELGLDTVEYLETTDSDIDLMAHAAELADVETKQLREGVVLRLENEGRMGKFYKYKSTKFCILEGIKANDPNYVNLEEVS